MKHSHALKGMYLERLGIWNKKPIYTKENVDREDIELRRYASIQNAGKQELKERA